MIASFSNNLIFLKTRKTAGTSVETILSTWCSGEDIVTPFSPADEEVRRAMGGKPTNYLEPGSDEKRFFNHMGAAEVRTKLPDLWGRAFKFTVERHPYERVVSRVFWWLHRRDGDPVREFNKELDRVLKSDDFVSNRPIYCIDGKVAVDEVVLYDKLWPRMAELAARFGRSLPSELPRAKGGFRVDRRPAREILTDAQKARIYEMTRADFEEFGFEP